MNKIEYFYKALSTEIVFDSQWITSLLSYTVYEQDFSPEPYALKYEGSKCYYYSKDRVWEVLSQDCDKKGLFTYTDPIDLPSGLLENAPQGIKDTTIGRIIQNKIVLCYPFNDKIEYINHRFTVKDIEKIIIDKLTDTPPDGYRRKQSEIYVDEYIRFCDACLFLSQLTSVCVPSVTRKAITPPPGAKALRDSLVEQYKDRLDDDTVISHIGDKLKALDQEYMAGDPSLGFLIKKNKDFNIVRVKEFLQYGRDQSFDLHKKAPYIPRSLYEGLDFSNIDSYINGARMGTYKRGVDTQLGGVAVKELSRSSSNCSIDIEDCGSRMGLETTLKSKYYLGYRIIIGDKSVLLTQENIDSFMGKKVILRSPAYCKAQGTSYCSYCAGPRLSLHTNGISASINAIGSIFLAASMSAMHGKVLATKQLEFDKIIS